MGKHHKDSHNKDAKEHDTKKDRHSINADDKKGARSVPPVGTASVIFDPSYDVVADVFGESVSQKVKKNTVHSRKKSLMKELGVSQKDVQKIEDEHDKLRAESTMSFMPLSPDLESSVFPIQTIQPTAAPKKGLAVDQNNRIYEIELRDVIHPTYNPPLGSYEFYKVHEHYLELMEDFKNRNKPKECEGLQHIWQQKIKSELLNRYPWPPHLMSKNTFWTYGYCRDYFPLETRVNLEISKMVRKSLEDLLFGTQSRLQKNIRSTRHRLASGFNFGKMKRKSESKMQEAEAAKKSEDIVPEKKVTVEQRKHHHRVRRDSKDGIKKFSDEKGEKEKERVGKDKKETRGRRYTESSITFKELPKSVKPNKIKNASVLDMSKQSDSATPPSNSINGLFDKKNEVNEKPSKHEKKHRKSYKIETELMPTISKEMTSTPPSESINRLFDKENEVKKDKSFTKEKKHEKSKRSKSHAHPSDIYPSERESAVTPNLTDSTVERIINK